MTSVPEPSEIKTAHAQLSVAPMAPLTANVIFSEQAARDLKHIKTKFHGSMPFSDDAIEKLADEILDCKGQCRPELASKIRGTKTFWRSWLGRDYRIDWHYTNQNDIQQIEIRHVGPKKNFTYRS